MSTNQGLEDRTSGLRRLGVGAAMVSLLVLSACVAPRVEQPVEEEGCRAAAADDALVGSWLNVRKQPGVSGELRTHFLLNADAVVFFIFQIYFLQSPR